MSQTTNPGKHRESIIDNTKARRVRRPGSRRQLSVVGFVLVALACVVGAAYLILRPEEDIYTLRDYTTAVIEVKTIEDSIQLGGTIRAQTEATLRAPESGILDSVEVDVGDWVVPGQVVAVLDATELQNTYDAEAANLAQAQRAYEMLRLTREQTVLLASRTRNDLESALVEAVHELAEARELHLIGTITTAELREREAAERDARQDLVEHDEDQDLAKRFHDIEKQDMEDSIRTIEESIADLLAEIDATRMKASTEGRVVWTIDTIQAVGARITENEPILQIAGTRAPFVATEIEEQYTADIAVGQPVSVTMSGQIFDGSVKRLGLLATTPSDGGAPRVDLDIAVEAEGIEAIPGSTALVEIVVATIPDALVLPRGPYLSTGNNVYLYRVNDESANRVRATFGAVTEQHVEILTGVSAGEEIIISSYQNYIDYTSIELRSLR